MYKSTWEGTVGCCYALGSSLLTRGTLGEAMAKVERVLSKNEWLDGRSRSDIRSTCDALCRSVLPLVKRGGTEIGTKEHVAICRAIVVRSEDVMKAWNRAWRREFVRKQGSEVKDGMALLRERDDPIVFYLVSSHQKPQKAHAELQGKVLVDRYWKSSLGDDMQREVGRYVKAHGTLTVQKAMGAPWYLVVRPNCRHQLIPLRTADVLSMPEKALKARFNRQAVKVRRPITDEQRAHVLGQMKNEIKRRLSKVGK